MDTLYIFYVFSVITYTYNLKLPINFFRQLFNVVLFAIQANWEWNHSSAKSDGCCFFFFAVCWGRRVVFLGTVLRMREELHHSEFGFIKQWGRPRWKGRREDRGFQSSWFLSPCRCNKTVYSRRWCHTSTISSEREKEREKEIASRWERKRDCISLFSCTENSHLFHSACDCNFFTRL